MKQDYIYALQNYKDYMGVREIMDQCTEHFVYGKELVGCNDEKEVLSKYIYEIEKEKVKDLLRKILWEGAIRYVEG